MIQALQIIFGFLLTIFIIVGVHEYGHYMAARRFGVKTVRFSIGIGRPIFSRVDANGTEWAIAPYPIGGYLQMIQSIDDAHAQNLDPKCSFEGRPRWQRSIIVAAGPIANFVLAAFVFFCAALYGTEGLRARIGSVSSGSLAAEAGLQPGDDIVAIEGREVSLWSEVYEELFLAASSSDLEIEVANASNPPATRVLALASLPPSVLESRNILQEIGLGPDESYLTVVLEQVVADSPAELAGLQPGDAIIAVGGNQVSSWREIVAAIEGNPGQSMLINVLREDELLEFEAVPDEVAGSNNRKVGRLGISPVVDRERFDELFVASRASPGKALASAWHRTTEAVALTFRFIGNLIIAEISLDSISGPVGIASYAGQAVEFGLYAYLIFLAHISISLGVLNLLPIPVLDGGYLLQFAIEGAMRRNLSEFILQISRVIGICCIVMLMSVAIYNDLT